MTIAIIGIITVAVMIPAFFCAGFYYGFVTAEGVFSHRAVTQENIPGFHRAVRLAQKAAGSLHTETEEERLARILAENVENFGTGVPQKEVV